MHALHFCNELSEHSLLEFLSSFIVTALSQLR
jgi:hypothetical protein